MRLKENVSLFTDTAVVWLTASVSALPESDHATPAGMKAVVRVSELPVRVKATVEKSGSGDAGVTWPKKSTGGSGMAGWA